MAIIGYQAHATVTPETMTRTVQNRLRDVLEGAQIKEVQFEGTHLVQLSLTTKEGAERLLRLHPNYPADYLTFRLGIPLTRTVTEWSWGDILPT